MKKRIVLLDEIRGCAILCMVVYHFCFDLILKKGIGVPFFDSLPMNVLRDCFAGLFIFISGVSCLLSRNNLRRGVLCFGAGILITVVSAVAAPDMPIRFGILHLLGVCMILYALTEPLLQKIPPFMGILCSAVLFALTFFVRDGYLGFSQSFGIPIPPIFYQTEVFFPFGIMGKNFVSGDYYPLLPWMFCFLAGSFAAFHYQKRTLPAFVYNTHSKFLARVGRYTLWIYLLHQPILFLLIALF